MGMDSCVRPSCPPPLCRLEASSFSSAWSIWGTLDLGLVGEALGAFLLGRRLHSFRHGLLLLGLVAGWWPRGWGLGPAAACRVAAPFFGIAPADWSSRLSRGAAGGCCFCVTLRRLVAGGTWVLGRRRQVTKGTSSYLRTGDLPW